MAPTYCGGHFTYVNLCFRLLASYWKEGFLPGTASVSFTGFSFGSLLRLGLGGRLCGGFFNRSTGAVAV